MNKQYREIDLHEALDAKIAGKEVEIFAHHSENWVKSYPAVLSLDHKHRILVEKYKPEVGEMVSVAERDLPREFFCMDGDKYVCRDMTFGCFTAYDEAEKVEQPKPVAREWWVDVDNSGSVLGVSDCDDVGMIKVREVLE